MTDHYFATDPSSPERRTDVVARIWGHRVVLQSASGVFSHRRVDLGTRVLLRSGRPDPDAGTVLDLGCGYGVLTAGLALELPAATVWAVDVNERALALTRTGVDRLGVGSRVRTARPDDVPANVVFDEIWSNPPIRIGKPAVQALLQRWLPRLTPDGRAVMVVGRNLGADSYQRWLGEQGWACHRLASAKGFRVFDVRRR